ncbi:TPA: MarR family transcriptional regulator [Legionella pneumophila]|uniref:MarR family winged helix-turn-helix transcriptional regulator n=1 Tax=Legionella TaxID=445 RepID=UPI000EFFEA62|nr:MULTISPECIES: MarR family transcriptional regulator [Legionella]MCK1847883.1 MarR family transcriptional regulator [Legionella pneumophila]RMX17723.1 MarR family transcriptional regulator [Legionella jordanis]HAT1880057.1 MarR family transcriptional regulator [Legionella pneumophila]HAU0182676.1 MarR family transcriptional regulator [Legionella pneumophila]HAU0785976.1 MarR family transcriptional regulator [Legionella pneumophila]
MKNFPMVLYETAAAWRNLLDKRLKPLGLSQAKWRALLLLSMTKSPLTQIQLAKKLGIEAPTVVGLIDRLTKEGWVIRQDATHDRRVKVICLTEKAILTIGQIQSTADELSRELLAPLSETELEACLTTLQKIKKTAEESYE